MRKKRVVILLVGSAALLLVAGTVLELVFPNGADRASQPVSAEPTASLADEARPTISPAAPTPTTVTATADGPKQTQPNAEATAARADLPTSEPMATATPPRPTPTEPEPTPTMPQPTPTKEILVCCQCTAVGMDQDVPFQRPKGYTCAEFCFEGCLERGHGKLVCTLGRVGGYELACPWASP